MPFDFRSLKLLTDNAQTQSYSPKRTPSVRTPGPRRVGIASKFGLGTASQIISNVQQNLYHPQSESCQGGYSKLMMQIPSGFVLWSVAGILSRLNTWPLVTAGVPVQHLDLPPNQLTCFTREWKYQLCPKHSSMPFPSLDVSGASSGYDICG